MDHYLTDIENIYSSPEAYGLTIVGEVDDAGACYSFDMVVVWRGGDDALYYAHDVGCSCPSPFGDFDGVESLTPLNRRTWEDFLREMRDSGASLDDRTALIRRIEGLGILGR